jgi:hypothetical protein
VRQEYYDRSLTPAEFKAKTDTASRSVRTACHYNQGDAHRTSVKVEVEQYRSDKAARSEWASIAYLGTGKESRKLAKRDFSGSSWDFNWIAKLARENERDMGGKRVKGIDDVLFVRGRADFVGFRHNVLVRVSYCRSASSRRSSPRGSTASRPPKAKRAFTLATGHASTEDTESESLPLDTAGLRKAGRDLYDQSPEASCSRTARHKKRRGALTSRYDYADLSVRVAAKPQDQQTVNVGTELAGDMLINRYVDKDARGRVTVQALVNAGAVTEISDDDTQADALYVFDSARKTGRKKAFRRAFFNVGPYAFMLGVTRNSGLEQYSGRELGVAGYRKVVDAIAADVRSRLPK